MAAKDPRPQTQHWPSPWPYDFPVDGEVPTFEDKLERLAEKDRPRPPKAPAEPMLPPEAVKAIGFWVVVGIALFLALHFLLPDPEPGPAAVFETAAPATFASGGVHAGWKERGVLIANVGGKIVAVPAASGDPQRAPERYAVSVNPLTGNVVVDTTVTCTVAGGGCDAPGFAVDAR